MDPRDISEALQEITTSVNRLVAQLEARQGADSPVTDERDTLIGALKCAVQLAQLHHAETHRRLKLLEQAVAGIPAAADLNKLRHDVDRRVALLSEEVGARLNRVAEDVERRDNGLGMYLRLQQDLVRLDNQLISRKFTEAMQERFEKHYPEHTWDDAVKRFDRWVMTERTRGQAEPSNAFRKFLAVWTGEPRPRWLANGSREEADRE